MIAARTWRRLEGRGRAAVMVQGAWLDLDGAATAGSADEPPE